MNAVKKILLLLCVFFIHATPVWASPECDKYTDCDTMVACELALQVETAIAGGTTDYNGAVARALNVSDNCKTYPDKFRKNIDITVSKTPLVTVVVNWDSVRSRMQYGDQANFTNDDHTLLAIIVDFLGPDTDAQEKFFQALATAYINANAQDETARLNDAFVLDFLGTDDNFNKYHSVIIDLTGTAVNEDLGIDINWDDVLTVVSNVLDTTLQQRGAIVCENNRSYQLGIDVAGWLATAVAAVATFYAGGAGGAAVATGRAAIGTGLKAAAKGVAKVGGKATSRKIIKAGIRTVGKDAMKRGALKTGVKNFVKAAGKNLANKWVALAATGAAVWGLGKKTTSTGTTIYSLLSSDLDKSFLNCHDLDHNEGCYTVCGDGKGGDDYLNKYALKPVLGKNYCVNPQDYALYEINPDGSRGKLMVYSISKHDELKTRLTQKVQESSESYGTLGMEHWGCDWNEDDIDMYFGAYVYDPDTLELTDEAMVIDDAMRLDN